MRSQTTTAAGMLHRPARVMLRGMRSLACIPVQWWDHQIAMHNANLSTCLTIAALFIGTAGAHADASRVRSCGQAVTGKAVLTENLDCSTYDGGPAVTLDGTLELNGFTITGSSTMSPSGVPDPAMRATVYCPSNCRIEGPGRVERGSEAAVSSRQGVEISETNVVAGDATVGVLVESGSATIQASTVSGSYANGVVAANVVIRDSTVFENGNDGIRGGTVTVVRSEVSGNGGDGIDALATASVRETVIADNSGSGIAGHALVRVSKSEITSNGSYAATGAHVIQTGSVVGENCANPGAIVCADVRSCTPPSLVESYCDSSINCTRAPTTWGVCEQD